ncbi:MAG TPA: zinc-dependent metalloprotease, partial [Actinotalea sp.]|nr:zinc-dependent metalloprotease [Actinotalea sp.]
MRGGDGSPLAAFLDEEQRARLDRVTAVMSLLEGHADVAMDRVPVGVLPAKRRLRARMEARRSAGGVQKVVRRLIGLDAKLAQYRDGAVFVRAVLR